MDSNLERSVVEQNKFQYYWTALTYTLLAASVQSAELSEYNIVSYLLEMTGWLCLLTCGLLLLRYLESRGFNMRKMGMYEEHEKANPNMAVNEVVKLRNLKAAVEKDRTKMVASYWMARLAFVAGLVFVVAARAIQGFVLIAT